MNRSPLVTLLCTLGTLISATIVSLILGQGAAQSQYVQQTRPFTIGVSLRDASAAPLFLALQAFKRTGMPVRLISIDQDEGPFALRVKEIDVLYTDGVSALMGSLKGPDLVFVAGNLNLVTGSLFTAPTLTGFSDPKIKTKGAVAAVTSYPSVRTISEVTLDTLAVRAILRANGIANVSVVPPNQANPFVLPAGEPVSEPGLLEGYARKLNNGDIHFLYASVERVPWMAAKKAKELRFGPVALQGVLIVARRSDVDSNINTLVGFLRGFSEGIWAFNDPSRGVKAFQDQLHVNAETASYIYSTYKTREIFKVLSTPNVASVSNLVAELARIVPDAKKLNIQTLIDTRAMKVLLRR